MAIFAIMETTLAITTERVDDLPLLFGHIDRMGLAPLLDAHFPTDVHWRGLSLGQLSTGWLTHILSQADHRMKVVQAWAAHRLETLSGLFGVPVRALDFSDDRLAAILSAFSDDEGWSVFEAALGGALVRVYDLAASSVRLDATTASGYFSVSDEGLFQFGHSKDHRPDLPQVKVMLSTLDPLALPVATQVLPGERADDPLYRPAVEAVRTVLQRRGLLYVGDSKMAALETRAFLEAGRDYYLCPLSKTHLGPDGVTSYLEPLWRKQVTAVPIARTRDDGPSEVVAEGFERYETVVAYADGEPVVWQERRLIIRSLSQAKAASEALDRRLEQALTALCALNERKQGKKRLTDWGEAHRVVEAILDRYSVSGLISVGYEQTLTHEVVRRYGDRPARQQQLGGDVTITATLNLAALEEVRRGLGWRVYVTNQPREQLSLEQAVRAYRDQYRIEQSIGRLKGQPLSLSPLYVQRDDHIKGLVRLLSLALRVLVLLEYQVRRRLGEQHEALVGLDAARPRASTARPTAERLLKAFAYVTLTLMTESGRRLAHVTPLSGLQLQILRLLELSPDLYLRLGGQFLEPT